jgi:hypothetical protein
LLAGLGFVVDEDSHVLADFGIQPHVEEGRVSIRAVGLRDGIAGVVLYLGSPLRDNF